MRNYHLYIATGALLSAAFWTGHANAYNWDTHSRMVERAIDTMSLTTPGAPAPPGVDAAAWSAYVSDLSSRVQSLSNLRPGLESDWGANCLLNTNMNLSTLESFRIRDLAGLHVERSRASESCGLKVDSVSIPARVGNVLGWHAGSVDDHVDDVALAVRPWNSFILTGLPLELLSRSVTYIGGALVAPFACLWGIFSGGGCHPGDAFDLVAANNPVDYIRGAIPGFGPIRSDDYTGVWHFIDVRASDSRYNDHRGMFYESAGPLGIPGAMDVAIMALGDASGLTLDASASDGVVRYGQFDSRHRSNPIWQAENFGHLEFSSLDNLARFGWEEFAKAPDNAAKLGWPLHALGDAAEPHHAVGTSAWGHRPFEDVAQDRWQSIIPITDEETNRLRAVGFKWWSYVRDHADAGQPGGVNVGDLVFALAKSTSDNVGGWAFNDVASTAYVLNETVGKALSFYGPQSASMTPLIEDGIGAMIALLARAAPLVRDPGDGNVTCAIGTLYNAPAKRCLPPGPPIRVLSGGSPATRNAPPDIR